MGCPGLSGLKAKAVMQRGTGQAGCVVDRILYLQIGAVMGLDPKIPKTGKDWSCRTVDKEGRFCSLFWPRTAHFDGKQQSVK